MAGSGDQPTPRAGCAESRAGSVTFDLRDPLLVLGPDLAVISANPAFYRLFGVTPAETEGFAAPELSGTPHEATASSDIYSIGVLLYYLVTGTYPVEGETWTDFLLAHARFERTPLGDVRPDVPARFVRVVEKATSIRPDDRYGSPGAMLTDLTTAATGVARPVRRVSQTDSRKRKAAEPKPAVKAAPSRRRTTRTAWPRRTRRSPITAGKSEAVSDRLSAIGRDRESGVRRRRNRLDGRPIRTDSR